MSNTKLGKNALKNNINYGNNTAIGKLSLNKTKEGFQNTAVGSESLLSNITAHNNTAVGFKSLEKSVGLYNTSLGALTGKTLINGKSNVIIGKEADVSKKDAKNQIIIGANAKGVDDNSVTLGNNNVNNVFMSEAKNANLHCGVLNIYNDKGEKSYSLPDSDGNANQVLQTDGNGNLSWKNDNKVSSLNDLSDCKVDNSINQIVIGEGATSTFNNSVTLGNSDVSSVYMSQDSGATVFCKGLTNTAGNGLQLLTNSNTNEKILIKNQQGAAADSIKLESSAGGITLASATTLSSTLGVQGDTTLTGDLIVNGGDITNSTVGNDVNVFKTTTGKTTLGGGAVDVGASGSITTIKGTMNVDEAVTLDSTLGVTGTTTLSNVTIADGTNDLNIASHDGTNGLKLAGTLVTSTAAELNLLDGVTSIGSVNSNIPTASNRSGNTGEIRYNTTDNFLYLCLGDNVWKRTNLSSTMTFEWTQLGNSFIGNIGEYIGYSVSLNANGTRIAIGNSLASFSKGNAKIYDWNGSAWVQVGSNIVGQNTSDRFGNSISLSADGNRVAIGATKHDNDKGHVRIYDYNGSNWVQVGSDIDGEAANDLSGYSVSLSADGSRVAIGATYNNSNRGQVRIYEYNITTNVWDKLGDDIDGEAANDNSGNSVSLSANGSRVAIGAYLNNGNGNNSGHVRIYEYDGTSWNKLGTDIDGEAANDYSGYSVSLSSDGSRVAIGAPFNDGNGDDSGHVRIYDWNGSAWDQVGSDINGEAANYEFGLLVSLSADGNRVAISSYNYSNSEGYVQIFDWNGNSWVQVGNKLIDGSGNSIFGYSISLSGDGKKVAISDKDYLWNKGQVVIYEFPDDNADIVNASKLQVGGTDITASSLIPGENGAALGNGINNWCLATPLQKASDTADIQILSTTTTLVITGSAASTDKILKVPSSGNYNGKLLIIKNKSSSTIKSNDANFGNNYTLNAGFIDILIYDESSSSWI